MKTIGIENRIYTIEQGNPLIPQTRMEWPHLQEHHGWGVGTEANFAEGKQLISTKMLRIVIPNIIYIIIYKPR